MITGISNFIVLKNYDLLRNERVELFSFYWDIGIILNEYKFSNKIIANDLIKNLSDNLVLKFGESFSKQNLKSMMLFVEHFPEKSLAEKVACFLSWQHIIALFKVKSFELKLHYIELVLKEGYGPRSLSQSIKDKLLENIKLVNSSSKFNKCINKEFEEWYIKMLLLYHQQPILINQINNNFNKLYKSSDYHKFLSPSYSLEHNHLKSNEEKNILLSKIIDETFKFRKEHNYRLNANLNRSFREIGKYINDNIGLLEENSDLINNLSEKLTKKYGYNFKKTKLSAMVNFFINVSNSVSVRISGLVTWEHLQVIINLKEPKEQLFYSRITAKEGLSLTELKELIRKKTYQNTNGASLVEEQTLKILESPIINTIHTKAKKQLVIIKEYLLDIGEDVRDSKSVINILENKYFPIINKKL